MRTFLIQAITLPLCGQPVHVLSALGRFWISDAYCTAALLAGSLFPLAERKQTGFACVFASVTARGCCQGQQAQNTVITSLTFS